MESGIEQSFVTKKDLEATKKELLAKLATKEEIKKLATKEELKKLATKKEIGILANEVASLSTRLTSVEVRLSNVEENTQLILQAVDGIAGKFDDYQTEKAATEHTFRRHEKRLDEHDTRIEVLERKEVL